MVVRRHPETGDRHLGLLNWGLLPSWTKARGKTVGHPFKMTPRQRQEALARRESGELLTEITRSYNVSAGTISRLKAPAPSQGGA